jgi:hypothetical protein
VLVRHCRASHSRCRCPCLPPAAFRQLQVEGDARAAHTMHGCVLSRQKPQHTQIPMLITCITAAEASEGQCTHGRMQRAKCGIMSSGSPASYLEPYWFSDNVQAARFLLRARIDRWGNEGNYRRPRCPPATSSASRRCNARATAAIVRSGCPIRWSTCSSIERTFVFGQSATVRVLSSRT